MTDLLNPLQMADSPTENEREAKAAEAGNNFILYFEEHQIFLDEALCSRLKEFNQTVREAWAGHLMNRTSGEGGMERWDGRAKAWDSLNKQVPALRCEIERVFRKLLGHELSPVEGVQ
jgi:hypothetical protein